MAGHDLVVGGSGMLAALCEALAHDGRKVSVVARRRDRLEELADRGPAGLIRPVPVDYRNSDKLEQALQAEEHDAGAIERAVCWMHSVAPEGPLLVARHVRRLFCHVLASVSADPSRPELLSDWRLRFVTSHPYLEYRAVVLGFVFEGGKSRWLSDTEISEGVERAVKYGSALSVVGIAKPWSDRPGSDRGD